MNTSNPLILWIIEMFQRLMTKSPTFFKVWKVITGIPVLIIAIPDALQLLNIHLPQVFSAHIQDVVGWASTAMLFMSFLPSQSTPVAVDVNGNILKTTNDLTLPFTANSEQKALLKQDLVKEMVTTGNVSTSTLGK